ncbi:MAG TPA: nucleotidyltransferase domain-containing protein [Bosea sp. (in: a-proteobacteria)]|jgi:predicted nucleotidyltransferase|nr:nucleotidyltransferase domain-containing protein [Bosea sp. (in: a-proteobacteria)]
MGDYLTLRDRHERNLASYRASVEILKPVLVTYAREQGGAFILFGSAARGEANDTSDVDILVDFPETSVMTASGFAERSCWALGLKPDVRPVIWTSPKVVERARAEGVVLS